MVNYAQLVAPSFASLLLLVVGAGADPGILQPKSVWQSEGK